MLLFRDQKVLKQIAEQQDIHDINEDALRKVSEEVESKLRLIIQDSLKYSAHFHRDKLKVQDIKFAINDVNMTDIIGYEVSDNNSQLVQNGRVCELNNRELQLKQQIVKELVQFRPHQPISMQMGWLLIDSNIVQSQANSHLIDMTDQEQLKENRQDDQELKEDKDGMAQNNIIKIQYEAANILSNEMNNFFNLIVKTINQEYQDIDDQNGITKLQKQKEYVKSKQFIKSNNNNNNNINNQIVLSNIREYQGINNIIPFLMGYLLEEHSQVLFNGIQKKQVLLDILWSAYANQNSNIEYHLHFLIRILVHFISGHTLSQNNQDHELHFREESAQLLATLVINNSIKYDLLKQEICNCLLEVLAKDMFSYSMCYGVVIFFYQMETNIIKEKILPIIGQYLQHSRFLEDINNNKQKKSQNDHQMAILLYNLFKRIAQKLVMNMNLSQSASQNLENKKLLNTLLNIFGEALQPIVLSKLNTSDQLQMGVLLDRGNNSFMQGLDTLF